MSAALVTQPSAWHVIAVMTTFMPLPAWSHVRDVIKIIYIRMVNHWLCMHLSKQGVTSTEMLTSACINPNRTCHDVSCVHILY